jgi:acetyltransferase-like isoleucine patch superfamily enzyme
MYYEVKHLGREVKVYPTAIFAHPETIEIGDGSEIYDYSFINGGKGVHIGPHNHIAMFVSVTGGGELWTGEYVGIGPGARIITGTDHYGDGRRMSHAVPPEEQCTIRGVVRLEKDVFIGANAIVYVNVTIGEGAIVGMGAVVLHDVEPWAIVAGVPAKVIGHRPKIKE